jgi:uncharacterized membrane protein SpoIIM required for sporulation
MHPNEFYHSRKADWEKLNHLLDRCQDGVESLSPEEVHKLGQLYRLATADLALAQRDFPEHRVTQFLNQLVARAHAVVYRGEPMAWRRIKRFITTGYPSAFRQAWPFILTAFLMFLIPALVAGLITAWNPPAARWLLPEDVQQLIPIIEDQKLWVDIPVLERPYASAFIMQNNIRVAFMAFGGGMLLGLYTTWIMVSNGLILGGITGLTAHYGVGFELWTFVIGHGMVELSVIFIAGGTGLMLGWAIVRPGLLRRRDSLMKAAQHAVRLVAGCIPLLVIAGIIEGFISPAETLPWFVKWAVGLTSGALLYAYLFLAGGKGETDPDRL